MGQLVFEDIDAIKELYEHAKGCANHRSTYGEQTGPGLWLVHDQGVYLMSNGIPHLERPGQPESSKIVPARGCDPKKDSDYWSAASDLVGGDDFVEFIEIATWDQCMKMYEECGAGRVEIDVSPTQFVVTFVGRAKKKSPKPQKAAPRLEAVVMSDDIDID